MNSKRIAVLVLAGIIVGTGIFFLMQRGAYAPVDAPSVGLPQEPASPVGCTEEAKLCPDGTSVGRTGPNCSFAECPALPMQKPRGDEQVMCTMDAMQCPDGSYVGRTGPKCEFVCPQ